MDCFNRTTSPALMMTLDRFLSAEKPLDVVDHCLCEFDSVRYHVQASSSDADIILLSIQMPQLFPKSETPNDLPDCVYEDIRRVYHDTLEVARPPKEGYLLTLRLHVSRLPRGDENRRKSISEISSLRSIVLTSQLKDMLSHLGAHSATRRMYNLLRLAYHPREPFFLLQMQDKITVIFPMRFKDEYDVALAASFFQELADAANSAPLSEAPICTWSPIPPPELRGEAFEHLVTNGGFLSLEILPRHVKGTKLEKVLQILLGFHAFVKLHTKETKGFVQRAMRRRSETLAMAVREARAMHEEGDDEKAGMLPERRREGGNGRRRSTSRGKSGLWGAARKTTRASGAEAIAGAECRAVVGGARGIRWRSLRVKILSRVLRHRCFRVWRSSSSRVKKKKHAELGGQVMYGF